MTKRPGESVKLRVAFGDVPQVGSVLCLPSGRRYWVSTVAGKTLHCRVMAPADPIPEDAVAVLPWRWAPRKSTSRSKPIAQLIAESCT